jgi:flagellar motility protein MotE (MotC chaperone)
MKKLLNVLMLTLALNFLALAGGVAYLFKTGALTKEKVAAIKLMLGPATTQTVAEGKKDQPDASTQPTINKLEELLATVSGRPAGEQVEFMQRTFDAQQAQLDRRQRELQTLKDLIQLDRKAQDDRQKVLDTRQKKLDEREQAMAKDMADKGFTDSLAMYESLPPKQAKDIFLGLNDATATKYLRAMEPARAAKILKEFKTPAETERLQRMIEMIRGSQTDAKAN